MDYLYISPGTWSEFIMQQVKSGHRLKSAEPLQHRSMHHVHALIKGNYAIIIGIIRAQTPLPGFSNSLLVRGDLSDKLLLCSTSLRDGLV